MAGTSTDEVDKLLPEDQPSEDKFTEGGVTYLADKGKGEDLLNDKTMFTALSQTIKDISPPVTIGILGKYGSGKSFLLSQILEKLKDKRSGGRLTKDSYWNWCLSILVAVALLGLCGIAVAMLVVPSKFVIAKSGSSTAEKEANGTHLVIFTPPNAETVTICGAVVLAVLIFFFFSVICLQNFLFSRCKNLQINCMAGFSKQPKGSGVLDNKDKKDSFIFVEFDAWEYVGCDLLWAGIITKLSQEIEKEIGVFATRLFRAQFENVDQCDEDKTPKCCTKYSRSCQQICNYPKTKWLIPTLCWWIIAVFSLISIFLIGIVFSIGLSNSVSFTALKAAFIVVPILAASFAAVKTAWTMFYSQSQRILDKLKGVKSNMAAELGFMHSVKMEVKCITDLLKWAELYNSEGCRYKVVICIDNLDRIPLPKVKAVLEAVHVLLSDESSPFICLLAIDQRTAVCSVEEYEEKPGKGGRERRITCGYEYLKKIITLPVYLSELTSPTAFTFLNTLLAQAYHFKIKDNSSTTTEAGTSRTDCDEENKATKRYFTVNYMRFMKMYHNFSTSSLFGNPRNIKRIVNIEILSTNILNLTTSTEEGRKLKDDEKKLVDAWEKLAFKHPGRTLRLWKALESNDALYLNDTLPTIFKSGSGGSVSNMRISEGDVAIVNTIDGTSESTNTIDKHYIDFLNRSSLTDRQGTDVKELIKTFEDYAKHRYMVVCVAFADQWPCRFGRLIKAVARDCTDTNRRYVISNDRYESIIEREIRQFNKDPATFNRASEIDGSPSLFWTSIKKLELTYEDLYILNKILKNLDSTLTTYIEPEVQKDEKQT